MAARYTINKDVVHVIKENGKPVGIVINDQANRVNIVYPLNKAMSGDSLGEFLSKIIPLPEEFEKEDK